MLSKSIKWLFTSAVVAMCLISAGCCGPYGCGVGCGALEGGCNDCDGSYYASRPIPCGPLAQLHQLRRSLVCGGGCGETYYGEWISTPPDASDPCYRDQFVGGATKCTPFCRPGCGPYGFGLLAGLYGRRHCIGSESCGGCGSCSSVSYDTGGCDSCSSGAIVSSAPIFESGPVSSGCSTCDARSAPGSTRVAQMAVQQMESAGRIQNVPTHTARVTTSGGRMYR